MSAGLRVEVIYAERGKAWRTTLALSDGATVGEALALLPTHGAAWPQGAFAPAGLAVFGREVARTDTLRDGDRLELLRALPNDPKRARRARALR
jgi:putative ubiquitin-RnfH superfamily antitoxin RatB of RatAB toxin-antitoxin module